MGEIPFEEVAPEDVKDTPPELGNAKGSPKVSNVFGKLGVNRKSTRSGVRKLVKADIETLARTYTIVGMGLSPVLPKVGNAFVIQAEACAQSWADVADQNDNVRRAILWLIEGGAWSAVLMAHLPILIAAVPEDRLPSLLQPQNGEAALFPFPQPESSA